MPQRARPRLMDSQAAVRSATAGNFDVRESPGSSKHLKQFCRRAAIPALLLLVVPVPDSRKNRRTDVPFFPGPLFLGPCGYVWPALVASSLYPFAL
jgi:hypothetical protein